MGKEGWGASTSPGVASEGSVIVGRCLGGASWCAVSRRALFAGETWALSASNTRNQARLQPLSTGIEYRFSTEVQYTDMIHIVTISYSSYLVQLITHHSQASHHPRQSTPNTRCNASSHPLTSQSPSPPPPSPQAHRPHPPRPHAAKSREPQSSDGNGRSRCRDNRGVPEGPSTARSRAVLE